MYLLVDGAGVCTTNLAAAGVTKTKYCGNAFNVLADAKNVLANAPVCRKSHYKMFFHCTEMKYCNGLITLIEIIHTILVYYRMCGPF